MRFITNGSERMRITSDGDILFGCTSLGNDFAYFEEASSNRRILNIGSSTTSSIDIINFRNPNGIVGGINTDGFTTSFSSSSDYRLKENVVKLTNALDKVSELKPSRFNFINEQKTVNGFLAHEVENIVPEAISGTKDQVDDKGNPIYQRIDQSKLVPLLVGAIQELKEEIEILRSQINS
jgi:Glu-tRNA(Gln) amidotransferase subunit E-like FAD-binding protein